VIHHLSIAVNNPQHVSQVLAELLLGKAVPFPGHPGSYIALALDSQGTMIEMHPLGTALVPGDGEAAVQHLQNSASLGHTATHCAISVPVSVEQIQAIATREGWRMVHCHRGDYFDVIEFWLENQFLVELLPPEIVTQYLSFMAPKSLEKLLATTV
jgi:hypothetical protein